jgi:hypothetical protein
MALHRAQNSRQQECNRRSKTHGRFRQPHRRDPDRIRQVLAGLNRPSPQDRARRMGLQPWIRSAYAIMAVRKRFGLHRRAQTCEAIRGKPWLYLIEFPMSRNQSASP